MRRKDALKRIVEYCGSREYEITKEEVVPAGEAQTSGVIASFGANEIREIHFVCKK